MSIEDEKDMASIIDKVLMHASDCKALRISLAAALRLFYSKGFCTGYDEAMDDAKNGKDQRVIAHLN